MEAQPRGTRRAVPKRVLAFDWGLRKLMTAVVMEQDAQGHVKQLTGP
ncbi:MAG: hypothetical protein H5U00_10245 [Clostridia bacterium]|nr:hypothetical protein [Clostridia bacterium]